MKRLLLAVFVVSLALPAFAADQGGPAPQSERDSFTVAFTGDILIHSSVWRSAQNHGRPYDFRPMFLPTRPIIAGADLAICHLETPVDPNSAALSGFPRFNAPREIVDGVVFAGFDGCTTASNHSNDQGPEGIARTLSVLTDAGLEHSGMRERPEDSLMAFYEVGGVTVASISATYGLNGLELPSGSRFMVQMLNQSEILAEAEAAKAAGAELVVVSIHCCVEYATMPTATQRTLATNLIRSDFVDLVVSHHAHVVSPIEWVDGKPVIHGLGNFLSNQSARAGLPAHTQDGVIAVVTAQRDDQGWRFASVEVVPTWVDEPQRGHVVRIADPGSVPFNRTMNAINMLGAEIEIFELPEKPTALQGRIR